MRKTKIQKLINQTVWIFFFSYLVFTSCDVANFTLKEDEIINNKELKTSEEKTQQKSWQDDLKHSFIKNYKTIKDCHEKKMQESYPVITQAPLNMTLIRSNGEKSRFEMDKKTYLTLTHTSHPPLTIYSILSLSNFTLKHDSTILNLNNYNTILDNAINGIQEVDYMSYDQKRRISSIFSLSKLYIQKVLLNKKTTKKEFQEFYATVIGLLSDNLHDGAMEQLTQFYEKLESWKREYPNENWDELRVVVMGHHQPRELHTLKLFFQWLLNEPEFEKKVVYAEFQFSIFGKNSEKAENLALRLLATVDLDQEVSYCLSGDETLLEKDVMGPSTVKILKNWGHTKWFSGFNQY